MKNCRRCKVVHVRVSMNTAVALPGVPGVTDVTDLTGDQGDHRYEYWCIMQMLLSLVSAGLEVVVIDADATGIKYAGDNRLDVRNDGECKCRGMAKVTGNGNRLRVVVGLVSPKPRLPLLL